MSKRLVGLMMLLLLVMAACTDGKLNFKKKRFTKRDVTITPKNSFTDLFLDSMRLEGFITKQSIDSETAQHMRSFYNSRNYQFAWFNKDGLNEPGLAFWNLYTSFISLSKDSTLFDTTLAERMRDFTDGDTVVNTPRNEIVKTELDLTRQFFIYAKVAYAGRVDPEELQWFIPRKKVDALALLDSLVSKKGKIAEEEWEPLNPQYQSLKKELIRFNDIADKGGWSPIDLEGKHKYKQGDSNLIILQVKKRLYASGDLPQMDSTAKYTSTLYDAVLRSQKRFGFHEDGVIDAALVKELNVPVKQRIEQIMINLERMRWLPEKPAPNRIVANIPEFKIHVYENNQEAFAMDIVVGKEGHNTVIFNDELKYIVFSPYWNVPASIVKKEIMPAMSRNPNYLASHNMEITGHHGSTPVIRQKPGASNSLGRVKFLFPNNYNIYFHDTPAKSLFNKEKRAFSHGCMRLADAEKLAIYLLRNQPEWTQEKIEDAMHQTKEKWVSLKDPVPVFVSYFTAWVDDQGLLNFRDDIYGHDKKMAERLFVHPSSAIDTNTVVKN
jgi:murein L,D-transpeptidase YcbB/YkuD